MHPLHLGLTVIDVAQTLESERLSRRPPTTDVLARNPRGCRPPAPGPPRRRRQPPLGRHRPLAGRRGRRAAVSRS